MFYNIWCRAQYDPYLYREDDWCSFMDFSSQAYLKNNKLIDEGIKT